MEDFREPLQSFFRNYQDRGMKKWAGFYLSEQTAMINKVKKESNHINKPKVLMNEIEISRIIEFAVIKRSLVSIQLDMVSHEGKYYDDIVGFIQGFDGKELYVSDQTVFMDEIRNIEIEDFKKWTQS